MNCGGETIQLSFGPAANAVTSHLCNLQGLASTTTTTTTASTLGAGGDNDHVSPLCDPYVTHSIQKEIYVPRVLFVDGKNNFSPWPTSTSTSTGATSAGATANDVNTNTNTNTNWNGQVEIHKKTPIFNTSFNSNTTSTTHNNHTPSFVDTDITSYNINQLNTTQRNALNNFQTIASNSTSTSILSSNNNNNRKSRYHSSNYKHVSSQYVYSSSASSSTTRLPTNDGRCMQWDDEEEEEEEEEEEDEYYKQRKKEMEVQKWNQHEMEVQSELNHAWDTFFTGGNDTLANSNANVNANTHTHTHNNTGNKKEEEQQQDKNDHRTATTTDTTTTTTTATATATNNNEQRTSALHHLQWLNYFMPPHPTTRMYSAPLPFDHVFNQPTNGGNNNNNKTNNKTNQSIMYSHYCGKYSTTSSSTSLIDGITNEWRDELSDKIRKWMEDCDALKGIQCVIDNDKSLFGGIATSVLEELNDECKNAGKFSILVHDGDSFDFDSSSTVSKGIVNGGDGGDKADNSYWRSERKVVNSFRSHLNHGLNLHGIGENSDLVLPLSLTNCWNSLGKQSSDRTLFEASAAGALALEAMTLPYRLLRGGSSSSSSQSMGKKRSKIGIMSGYFQGSGQSDHNDAFPTVDKLSYHEFISSLRPSNCYTMLELSASMKENDFNNQLLQGTSVEKRKMEEERNRNRNSRYYRKGRGRDIEPGLWLEDSGPNGGSLCPLSPIDKNFASRSMHRHFSLSTAFRPREIASMADPVSTYTTLIMEGMGIRYRPQSSIGTVVRQSINDLTGSQSYAAGSYWKSVFNGEIRNIPILTVLGNTTRIHSHLSTTAKNMSQTLSRKYQGYLSRDSTAGIVPEREDCTDAVEHCLSLKDTYEPPMMFDEDEGSYFEDNSD